MIKLIDAYIKLSSLHQGVHCVLHLVAPLLGAREFGPVSHWRLHRHHVALVTGSKERVRLRLRTPHRLSVQV